MYTNTFLKLFLCVINHTPIADSNNEMSRQQYEDLFILNHFNLVRVVVDRKLFLGTIGTSWGYTMEQGWAPRAMDGQ